MKRTSLRSFNEAVRNTLVEVFHEGPTTPDAVVTAFRTRYPEVVTEYRDYGFDQYLKAKSRHTMKQIEGEIEENIANDAPMLFAQNEIPAALPIKRNISGEIVSVWISRKEAGLEEGRYYKKMLKANSNACIARLIDFTAYWEKIEPLLEANPDWKVGDAEAQLKADGVVIEDLFSGVFDEQPGPAL